MLECKDCGTRKIYSARTSDGKLCPKCNGTLFLPIGFLNHKKEVEENEHDYIETGPETVSHN
jgi:ribosomal protein S27E